jgi:hypothetical protein
MRFKRRKPAGVSIGNMPVQQKNTGIKQELEDFKRELLAELAGLLGKMQVTQVAQVLERQSDMLNDDVPVYIPETIGTGENIDIEINIESKESSSNSLDDAAKALRKKKKEDKDDR